MPTWTSRLLRAAALAALAPWAAPAGAQVPGPEAIEIVSTDDGPRVLLGGIGAGTARVRAAARLGGGGVVDAFFGGGGPLAAAGALDGLRCGVLVLLDEVDRVRDLYLECDGSRAALRRLADRFRAALAALPAHEDARGVVFGGARPVAALRIVPADEEGLWGRLFGPRQLRLGIRGRRVTPRSRRRARSR